MLGLVLSACSPGQSAPHAPLSAPLERAYADLLAILDAEGRRALEESQRLWLEHRRDYCGALGQVAGNGASSSNAECVAGLDAARLVDVNRLHRTALLMQPASADETPAITPERSEPVVLEGERPLSALALVPDSPFFATAAGATINVRERTNGRLVTSFEATVDPNRREITELVGSRQARMLITGSRTAPKFEIWDRRLTTVIGTFTRELPSGRVAVAGDGTFLALASQTIAIYNLGTGEWQEGSYPLSASPVALLADRDGRYLVAGGNDGTLELFAQELREGRLVLRLLETRKPYPRGDSLVELSLSARGDSLMAVSRKGSIRRFSVPNLTEIANLQTEYDLVGAMATTPDHALTFISGTVTRRGGRGSIRAFDLASGASRTVLRETLNGGPRIAFDPDSHMLIVADATLVRLLPAPATQAAFAALPADPPAPVETPPPSPSRDFSSMTYRLSGISPTAVVHAISVYEGTLPGGAARGFREHPEGTVDVVVGGSDPVILVLSSYEPVRWRVRSAGAARIEQIITFGHNAPRVEGTSRETKVLTSPATSRGSSSSERSRESVAAAVRELTGKELATFQTEYTGNAFSINAPAQTSSAPSGTIRRYIDENGVVHFEDARTPTTSPPAPR